MFQPRRFATTFPGTFSHSHLPSQLPQLPQLLLGQDLDGVAPEVVVSPRKIGEIDWFQGKKYRKTHENPTFHGKIMENLGIRVDFPLSQSIDRVIQLAKYLI